MSNMKVDTVKSSSSGTIGRAVNEAVRRALGA